MLLKDLREKMIGGLNTLYPERESKSLADILIHSLTGFSYQDILLNPGIVIDQAISDDLTEKYKELLSGKPVQYITGSSFFYGFEYEVDPSVLIPRPETEELVKWISDEWKDKPGLRILDIGTGSGCIIITLGKMLQDPKLTAIDISVKALLTASRNALKHNVEVDFFQHDILDEDEWSKFGPFDLVVSNPPYVRESEKALMKPNVLDNEPHEALFVPNDDALLFYRAIAKFAKLHLEAGGALYLEINENLGRDVVDLLRNEGFGKVVLKKDMQGKDRMVSARL